MPIDFWTGSGGVPGDFSYGTIHMVSAAALILVTAVMCVIGTQMKKSSQRKVIVAAAVFSIVFEIFWRLVFWKNEVKLIDLWPFYPCNLAGILVPLIALSKKTPADYFLEYELLNGPSQEATPHTIE